MDANSVNLIIDNIAAKLAIPSAQITEALSKIGIKYAVILVILLIVTRLVLSSLRKAYKFRDEPWILILGGIFLILIVILVYVAYQIIYWLISPEAWALDYILGKF